MKKDALSALDTVKVVFRSLREFFLQTKKVTSILLFMTLLVALLPLAQSFANSLLIDELVNIAGTQVLLPQNILLITIFYVGLLFADRILWAILAWAEKRQYHLLGKYFTLQFVRKSSELDIQHYENADQNDLIQKVRDSYRHRPQNMAGRTAWLLNDVFSLVANISLILLFSPLMSLVIFISVLPSVYISFRQADKNWGIWDENANTKRKFWDITGYLSRESSLMELRIFKTRNYLLNQAEQIFNKFNDKEAKADQKRAFIDSISTLFTTIGGTIFLFYLINQVIQGEITVGLMTFYLGVGASFASSLQALFRKISYYYEDAKYMDQYYKFMDIEKKIISGTQKLVSEQAPVIEFKNVDFTYPDSKRPVFKNLNLTIQPGERIALVGENGAGKTTLIKLLARFYDVTSGQILVDGVDLRDLDLDTWYSKIGILFQNFIRYEFMSLKGNIHIGDIYKDLDENRVLGSASKAEVDKFVDDLEQGYEQIMSKGYEGGTDLSGGQWQRVALARGFFRDAPILILDEPTSAIDAKAEYAIFDRLYEFTENKTVIIISHRFSTVRKADKIYVFDNGSVVESGSHQELMAVNGIYADSFRKQADAFLN